jgi:outer membrane protein TolC/DNA-binding NarL/FixJ family response regulator/multidrug efflux pump subunit AcrA (membrane-fusion protein)
MIRILLVDDQNSVRQGLQALLESKPDLEVVGTAEDGKSALEKVKNLRPDLVLIDIEMPGMNGVTATQKICQLFPTTKVIILTSHEDAKYLARALQAGAKGYLLKHALAENLEQAIRTIFRGYSQVESKILEKLIAATSTSKSVTPGQNESTLAQNSNALAKKTSSRLEKDDNGEKVLANNLTTISNNQPGSEKEILLVKSQESSNINNSVIKKVSEKPSVLEKSQPKKRAFGETKKCSVMGSLVTIVFLMMGITWIRFFNRHSPQPTSASTSVPIQTSLIETVSGLGRIETQEKAISRSAPTSLEKAKVKQVIVQQGDRVKKGQVIAILDDFQRRQAAIEEEKTQVRVARARLERVQTGAKQGTVVARQTAIANVKAELAGEIQTQQATIAKLAAQLDNARTELQRHQQLDDEGAISGSALDSKRLTLTTAQEYNFVEPKHQLGAAEPQIAASGLLDSERVSVGQAANLSSAAPPPGEHSGETVKADFLSQAEPTGQKDPTREGQERLIAKVQTSNNTNWAVKVNSVDSERASVGQAANLSSAAPPPGEHSGEPVKADFPPQAEPTGEKDSIGEGREQQTLKLRLSDAVNLALQNNRTIKNAYLQRIIDRQDLVVAEDEFVPNFTPALSANQSGEGLEGFSASSTAGIKLPTGGQLEISSTGLGLSVGRNGLDYGVSFTQPLLRGFGIGVNVAPIEIARLQEAVNIFEFKSTLSNTVTDAIEAYRRLFQAQEQLKIEQLALENAKKRSEIVQAFIDAGRLARIELVQSKTDIANREVSLLEARNQLVQARLDLVAILDIDRNLKPVAVAIQKTVELPPLDLDELRQLAFNNNSEYLQALARVEVAKLGIVLAKNERLWGVDLRVSYRSNTRNVEDSTTGLRAGLFLNREFGNLRLEQSVERSEVNLQQTKNNLQEARESLEIELDNRVGDVLDNFEQIESTKRARELSERQLENEREKLRLGVSGVRLLDLLNFESDLVQAKNREIEAVINYLNALTRLEQTAGITLDKWNIKIEGADVR